MNNNIEKTNEILPITQGIFKEMLKPDDSMFELVIVAAQRCKQLTNGANPRIIANLAKRKNTSIAVEEARQGLVPFSTADIAPK
ncbi:MAG: DNA-directed RNA polymerase subunit omega [Pyrinomonadaceae bacterium]